MFSYILLVPTRFHQTRNNIIRFRAVSRERSYKRLILLRYTRFPIFAYLQTTCEKITCTLPRSSLLCMPIRYPFDFAILCDSCDAQRNVSACKEI